MFSTGPSYAKLKTNLRLAVSRLKLLEKKKTELALKARKDIADYIAAGKYERAKIRVEHIVREDYLVEAMEVVEMYCDLLLARFGLIQQMKGLDDGLAEAISSIIWAAPRLQTDVAELKIISEQLAAKYGKPYAQACHDNAIRTVSEKLMHKLSVQAPPKILVEKYLIEIAKNYSVEYEPDPQLMREDEVFAADNMLINFGDDKNNLSGGGGGGNALPPLQPGFVGFPQPPMPMMDHKPFNYPTLQPPPPSYGELNVYKQDWNITPNGKLDHLTPGPTGAVPPPPLLPPSASAPHPSPPNTAYNIPPANENIAPYDSPPGKAVNPNLQPGDQSKPSNQDNLDAFLTQYENPPPYSFLPPDVSKETTDKQKPFSKQINEKPKPAPRSKMSPGSDSLGLPELPTVPTDSININDTAPENNSEEIDFDDLTKRFEDLKKKK